MKVIHAGLALAASAVLAAPVFAQNLVCDMSTHLCAPSTSILGAGPVMSSSGTAITSGTGVLVTPGAPSTVTVMPSNEIVVVPSTTVLGAGPAMVTAPSGTTMVVERHWVNVPAGVENRADFQRWMRLK